MEEDFLSLVAQAKALNSKVFSLARLELLAGLAAYGPDGVTYRELKAGLGLTDGALFANLKALREMGYLNSKTVKFEEKELELFCITPEGSAQWKQVRAWLCQFVACGRDRT